MKLLVGLLAKFNQKMKLRHLGEKETLKLIHSKSNHWNDKSIWIHSSSVGEFEQARPIIEKLKDKYPEYKILLTFFSPSGYELRKDYPVADCICYLPFDTQSNAEKFVNYFQPSLAIFIKYDFWYYFFEACHQRNIPLFSVSSIFRKNQSLIKDKFEHNKVLKFVTHFFVQNRESKDILQSIGYQNITISGDTRFDRVFQVKNQTHDLGFLGNFANKDKAIIVGSAWKEDLKILSKTIENFPQFHWIIVPHEVDEKHIEEIDNLLNNKALIHSKLSQTELLNPSSNMIIIDSVGKLNSIYSCGKMAYVGGAFGYGLHNILEPAAFGLPVVFGSEFDKFQEAKDLTKLGGAISINNEKECLDIFKKLLENESLLKEKSEICTKYIEQNIGASDLIINHLNKYL
jgi:3-deoxy-D-manno-octulosonic-acid transferase